MFNITKLYIFNELKRLKNELYHPFPYQDIHKIQHTYNKTLDKNDVLTADLNSYWANIAGSLSYMLKSKVEKIPSNQIKTLNLTFFEAFPQYSFLETEIFNYLTFYEEYQLHEKVRKLMLEYLCNIDEYNQR